MLTYRWLGAAGLEFQYAGSTLLVDPFFTRPPQRSMLTLAWLRGDPVLSALYAPRADAVLVTHAHYDHLLDVPEILLRCGAPGYGSANTCDLLALQGVPARQTHLVQPSARFSVDPFAVEVLPARHNPIPFARWLNGALPARLRRAAQRARETETAGDRPAPRPPRLRLFDYRMDACYSYRIQAGGQVLLVGNHPAPCDLLFLTPNYNTRLLADLLQTARPRQVILIHWDDFFRPLRLPLRPMLVMPAHGPRRARRWPSAPITRLDVGAFAELVQSTLSETRVQIPRLFEEITVQAQSAVTDS